MPMFKIYVGNIGGSVTDEAVRDLFEPYGEIEDVDLAIEIDGSGELKFLVDVLSREGEIAGKDHVDDGVGVAIYPQLRGERARVADAGSTA